MDEQTGQKVILIEDDDLIRVMYQNQLIESGIKTDAFASGRDGLAALFKNHYDLLLLDIMLNDSNGFDILRKLRQNPATKLLKVILLTNLGQESIIDEMFKLGAQGYLLKISYEPQQIVEMVKKYLED